MATTDSIVSIFLSFSFSPWDRYFSTVHVTKFFFFDSCHFRKLIVPREYRQLRRLVCIGIC